MKIQEKTKLIFCIIVCQAAGGIGALATTPKIGGWYAGLNKPWFSPPNWLFGPVWTMLYLLMGVAWYLVWREKKENKRAIKLFWVQLLFNILWSFWFFGLENPGLAFGQILLLVVAIWATIRNFWRISKLAGWLMVPYLAWVSFATVLNGAIYWLNR